MQNPGLNRILSKTLPGIKQLKNEARTLRQSLENDGTVTSHSKSLELLAKWYGYRDWNTLFAAAPSEQEKHLPHVGERISGFYLGQKFEGSVTGAHQLGPDKMRMTIKFDAPLDVVTFDSFLNYRQRVTATVDQNGQSVEKTSNGRPHMEINLV